MLANRVVVTQKGTWLIPFWREASTGCQNEQWHGQPGVLISRDKARSTGSASPCLGPNLADQIDREKNLLICCLVL